MFSILTSKINACTASYLFANFLTDMKLKNYVDSDLSLSIEKVSNVNLSENERIVNFRNLYLASFDNYYISRFVLGQYWKRLDNSGEETKRYQGGLFYGYL